MPFFQPVVHSDILIGCVSLRVQRPKTNKEKIKTKESHGKRAYLFTSKGSITVEAAIVTVIFMLAVFSVIGYFTMLNQQLSYQIKLNNMAVRMSKIRFYEQILKQIKDKDNPFQEEMEQLNTDKNYLPGTQTKENDEGEIDLVYSFYGTVPWIQKKIQITQRCLVKDWTGRDIKKSQELVYITKTGRVYHVTKECRHLSIHIRKISYSVLSTERNCYGKKYDRCNLCVKKEVLTGSELYVTEDGEKYHNSLTCSGLLRNVIIVEKSKVKNMPPCSSCVKE